MGYITKLSKEDEELVKKIEDVSVRRYIRNDLKRNYNEVNHLEHNLDRIIRSDQGDYGTQSELEGKIEYHKTIIRTIRQEVLKCNECNATVFVN